MHQITLSAAFNYYDSHCRTTNRSPESLKLNAYARRHLAEFLGGENISINKLDRFAVRNFLLWLTDEKKLSISSSARIFDVVRALCNYLVADDLLEINPVAKIKRPKFDEVPIKPLTIADVQALMDACNSKTFTGLRNRLIIALLFDTGVRATELTSIEQDDIDLDDDKILLRNTKGGKPRYAYYSATVGKLLSKYLVMRESMFHSRGIRDEDSSSKLFVTETGGNVDRHWLKIMIQRVGRRVGLKVYPHLLRHSCGVSLLMNGADVISVQRILGHSTLVMTKHYAQLADRDVKEKHRLASPADRLSIGKRMSRSRGPKPQKASDE